MAEQYGIYKCEACGNIVEILHGSPGEELCCGQQMKKMVENTVDASLEKHVPVIEKIPGGYKVKIGSIPHPMVPEHYIEWIQLIAGDRSYRKFLKPGEAPEAEFKIDAEQVTAREFCNIHLLWKS